MRNDSLLLLGIFGVYSAATAQNCGPADGQTLVVKVEAEDYIGRSADNVMTIQTNGDPQYVSGGLYVNDLAANSWGLYEVTAPHEGTYELAVFYFNMQDRYIGVTVNDQTMSKFHTPENSADWNGNPRIDDTTGETLPGGPVCSVFLIYLDEGVNQLKIGGADDWGPNIDYFEIYTTDQQIDKPEPAPIPPNLYQWSYSREIPKDKIAADINPDDVKNIFDEDEATSYEATTGDATITWEFDYPMSLTGMLVYTDSTGDANVSNWIVLRSADNIEWNEMSVNAANIYGKSQVYGLDLDENGNSRKPQYREGFESKYFKIIIPKGTKINELQLFGYPVQNHDEYLYYPECLTGSPYLYTGDPYSSTPQEWKTEMDDNIGFLSYSDEGIGDPWYEDYRDLTDRFPNQYTVLGVDAGGSIEIEYDFNDFTDVKSYSLGICEVSQTGRNPKSWQFLGSSDYGDTWDVLDEVTNFSWPKADFMNMKFDVPDFEEGKYIYYKFVFQGTGTGNWDFHLSEFQLFGDHLTTPTSIKQVNKTAQDVLVYSVKNAVVLSKTNDTPAQYQIFDITGKLVKQGFITTTTTTVALNSGIYIVKTTSPSSSEVTKVIVR